VASYILFIVNWLGSYQTVWYQNLPEETRYFKRPQLSYFYIYVYVFAILFFSFLLFAVISLVVQPKRSWLRLLLIFILSLSASWIWHSSVALPGVYNFGVMWINMVLFVTAIILYTIHKNDALYEP
jgi:hypothetical protein